MSVLFKKGFNYRHLQGKNMKLPHFYQQPRFLRATFRINTPMFAAGENQKDPELTPTSFKGVLRFWW